MYTSLSLAVASRPTRSLLSPSPLSFHLSFPSRSIEMEQISPLVPLIPCPVASFSCPSPCIDFSSSFSSSPTRASSLLSSLDPRKRRARLEDPPRAKRSSLRVPFHGSQDREKNEIMIRERERALLVYASYVLVINIHI